MRSSATPSPAGFSRARAVHDRMIRKSALCAALHPDAAGAKPGQPGERESDETMDAGQRREESLETPSGKGADDENFPVGSALIARRHRPHVALFYAFARAIDDIADNPALAPEDKLARLERFAATIKGQSDAEPKGVAMRKSLAETGVGPEHCLALIDAFRQDAVKTRYADWDELIAYCDRSAAPVGRYLLDLHGEDRALWPANDALCNSLQIINHLQDCADDYRRMDRVYLPMDFLQEAGAKPEDLKADRASPALRAVFDRMLEGVAALNEAARDLPVGLVSRRLGAESAVILVIARKLTARLRRDDPLAMRVELRKPALVAAATEGMIRGILKWR